MRYEGLQCLELVILLPGVVQQRQLQHLRNRKNLIKLAFFLSFLFFEKYQVGFLKQRNATQRTKIYWLSFTCKIGCLRSIIRVQNHCKMASSMPRPKIYVQIFFLFNVDTYWMIENHVMGVRQYVYPSSSREGTYSGRFKGIKVQKMHAEIFKELANRDTY